MSSHVIADAIQAGSSMKANMSYSAYHEAPVLLLDDLSSSSSTTVPLKAME